MALFANPKKKLARDTAHHWIGGHVSLLAYWALEHAGVFAAMQTPEVVKEGGLDPARSRLRHQYVAAGAQTIAGLSGAAGISAGRKRPLSPRAAGRGHAGI